LNERVDLDISTCDAPISIVVDQAPATEIMRLESRGFIIIGIRPIGCACCLIG